MEGHHQRRAPALLHRHAANFREQDGGVRRRLNRRATPRNYRRQEIPAYGVNATGEFISFRNNHCARERGIAGGDVLPFIP